MASVYQRKDSRCWMMRYKLPDGRWVGRSSRTTNRYEAMKLALSLEQLGRAPSRHWAEQILDQILATETVRDRTPFADYIRDFSRHSSRGWSDSTRASYAAIQKGLINLLGDIPLGDLSRTHLVDYRDQMIAAGRQPGTIHAHFRHIRAILLQAVADGRISANPVKGIKLPAIAQSPKKPFTWEQFRKLIQATDGEWRLLILLAGLTGQRLQDCLAVKRSDIAGNCIHFLRGKNKDVMPHAVPIHPDLREALQKAPGFVLFPELSQYPSTGSRSVSARFRDEILPRIGIVQPYQENAGGNKKVTAYSFHSLRHMLSTELNRAGVSPETRMAILGHEDAKVSKGYTHADMDAAAKALGLLAL